MPEALRIAFTGRKGGVGRTVMAVRLAEHWSKTRKIALRLNADTGERIPPYLADLVPEPDADLILVDTSRHDTEPPDADLLVVPVHPRLEAVVPTKAYLHELSPELRRRTVLLPNEVRARRGAKAGPSSTSQEAAFLVELANLSEELGLQAMLPPVYNSLAISSSRSIAEHRNGAKTRTDIEAVGEGLERILASGAGSERPIA